MKNVKNVIALLALLITSACAKQAPSASLSDNAIVSPKQSVDEQLYLALETAGAAKRKLDEVTTKISVNSVRCIKSYNSRSDHCFLSNSDERVSTDEFVITDNKAKTLFASLTNKGVKPKTHGYDSQITVEYIICQVISRPGQRNNYNCLAAGIMH